MRYDSSEALNHSAAAAYGLMGASAAAAAAAARYGQYPSAAAFGDPYSIHPYHHTTSPSTSGAVRTFLRKRLHVNVLVRSSVQLHIDFFCCNLTERFSAKSLCYVSDGIVATLLCTAGLN